MLSVPLTAIGVLIDAAAIILLLGALVRRGRKLLRNPTYAEELNRQWRERGWMDRLRFNYSVTGGKMMLIGLLLLIAGLAVNVANGFL